MGFHRSALLSVMAVSFMTGAVLCRPVYAEEGELIAQEDKAQINVRSLANTQADIVAAGAVGDHVQILEHSVGNDALIWYRVKLLKSGETGWIRGDLIKILGNPGQKAAEKSAAVGPKSPASAAPKPSEEGKKSTAHPPAAPVPLTPPKPPASAKSSAPPAATAVKPSVQPSSTPTASPPSNWGGAETTTSKSSPKPSVDSVTALNSSTTTIVAFKTSTYAVRVFSESGQLRLNLFNRKTKAIALSAVPVQSKSSSDGTTYSYQSDVKVTVLVPASGQPTLSAVALGETLKEQPETSTTPAAPTTPSAASAVPTPAAPESPASNAPAPVPAVQ